MKTTKNGYWLVRGCDQARFFVSENVNEPALNRVCNKVLSEKTGWHYWIAYCHGLDVFGNESWANADFTDCFI
jgi:hypothetical protein